MPQPSVENIEILGVEPLYKRFFKVDEYRFTIPRYDGTTSRPTTREVMDRGHAAGVLLFDPKKEAFVFVEQFRIGVYLMDEYPWVTECVAGIIDAGEAAENVAIREAWEESGCRVLDMEFIAKYYASPGGMTETMHLFCGRVDSSSHAELAGLATENEDIRVVEMSCAEAKKALDEGRVNNAVTLVALQWFFLNKDKLIEKWR